MAEERKRVMGRESVTYGAVVPGQSFEDEITPLLDATDDTTIGISSLTLGPTTGGGAQPQRSKQFIAALSVTLGAFALGNVLAWTSPSAEYLFSKGMDKKDQSWIGATMALGAATVVVPTGIAMDLFGRKITMLILVVPFIAGWLLIVYAEHLWMFILGRFITGMMGGAFSLTAPAYTSEIADDQVRGMLGSFFQLMVTIGIFFVYVIGGAGVDIKVMTAICAAVPLVFGVIFLWMPETPVYLLKRRRETEARRVAQVFRGPHYDIEYEIRLHKEAIEKAEREKLSLVEAFSGIAAKRALFITVGLMVFQQLSGVNAVIFYSGQIFKDAGSGISPGVSSIIVGVVQVIATFVSTQIVDRLGRRILLLISDSVMCICCILLGVFFFLKDDDPKSVTDIGWLPLLSLCVFIIVFSLGYGPIPWMIVGELFPQNIKGSASSISCMINWVLAFLVTKFFEDVSTSLGTGQTFWIFAGVSFLGTIFVFIFVPETKGKSLHQIQSELGKGSTPEESISEK